MTPLERQHSNGDRVPTPGDLWQYIATGYCEWENGDWPDDAAIEDAAPAAKHIAGYVKRWLDREAQLNTEAGEVLRQRTVRQVSNILSGEDEHR